MNELKKEKEEKEEKNQRKKVEKERRKKEEGRKGREKSKTKIRLFRSHLKRKKTGYIQQFWADMTP
jgi:hypothetical protein